MDNAQEDGADASHRFSASEFEPTPGGPFSALTQSMWPQDVMQKINESVSHNFKLTGPLLELIIILMCSVAGRREWAVRLQIRRVRI